MEHYFLTQELIHEFDPDFAPSIFDHNLLIVGLGGNGSHLALAAARMGFARIVGVDCDVVSPSNLSRQVLYTRQDLGRKKAEAAADSLRAHNLRSRIETHHLDILADRRRFGQLVAKADLVFVVLDQPATTFFAIDTCFQLRKPAVTGGTCTLSGLSTRVGWMAPGQRPCLNCALATHEAMSEWIRFYRYEDGIGKELTPGVRTIDESLTLPGGHPSTYPTACIGANLMMALAVNYFMGRTQTSRVYEMSILGLSIGPARLRMRANCPTCSLSGGPDSRSC
jgi:molybdopterin/thiamine biosynthesis adenylyltransferase